MFSYIFSQIGFLLNYLQMFLLLNCLTSSFQDKIAFLKLWRVILFRYYSTIFQSPFLMWDAAYKELSLNVQIYSNLKEHSEDLDESYCFNHGFTPHLMHKYIYMGKVMWCLLQTQMLKHISNSNMSYFLSCFHLRSLGFLL